MASQLKVAHIITSLDVGGAESMLARLLLASENPAEDQMVISLKDIGRIGVELSDVGVPVKSIGLGGERGFLAGCCRLARILLRAKPDVVQTWMYHSDFLGGVIARATGCRCVVWGIRGTHPPIGRPWTKLIMRCCAALSWVLPDRIVCVAYASKTSHIGFGYDPRRMFVIGNGMDCQAFDKKRLPAVDWRTCAQWPRTARVLGCVGRYHPDKGQDLLVEAISTLRGVLPDLHCVLVGRGCDSDNHELRTLLHNFKLERIVHLAGERRDIPACLSGFDLFCLPSRTEGFPNSLAEAMAAGVPALATAVGAVQELAGGAALVVKPGSSDHIAAGLRVLASQETEALESRARIGRSRVEDLFSIQAVRRQYYTLYTQLVDI